MKKIISTFFAAALLVSLMGCSNNEIPDTPKESDNTSTVSDNSSSNNNSDESKDLENPNSMDNTPEPQKPKGEPTFLICPDGTPVYTSEISEIYAGSEFAGNLETLTLEQAERRAEECEGNFNVECGGYAYGFIPKKALNRVDNPEMFKDLGDGASFDFLGEEDERSEDCVRIKAGDKFGTLTVKCAHTFFTDKWLLKEFSEEPGAYFSGGAVTFDGKVELTGYVDVWEDTDYQGAGGTMVFYPDGESSVKIPVILESGISHQRKPMVGGYFGDWYCDLGNMSEVECDVSGLHKGDVFVKVKITAENVSSAQGYVSLKLNNLEVI